MGARQTGKTTLAQKLLAEQPGRIARNFNCDNATDRDLLAGQDLGFLIKLIGDASIIFIDEAQKVKGIGEVVKLLVDHFKSQKQIIVSGSSSLNLLDATQEPLTGRKFVYHLYPLSLEEIFPDKNQLEIQKELATLLIYGAYPEVVSAKSFEHKRELLNELSSSYIYKDILEFQLVKNPEHLRKLLKALAIQIGSQVSYTELSRLVGIDQKTIERYIDLMEKSFLIFRLPPLSRNKRKEISKLNKIYFYDLGIRNAVINNFNLLQDRNDLGAMWENFLVAERLKYRAYHNIAVSQYFWRTYDGTEVDLVEEESGVKLTGYEFTNLNGMIKCDKSRQRLGSAMTPSIKL
ncbi:ATP-binding protein [Candidatus Uhrbacteria bacterium]|nr:ATP-binding protein [Candidatus Uhrbacteria bacterium]